MIKLAIIRILETYFRNPIIYLIPPILFSLYGLGIAAMTLNEAEHVSGMTIHVRPNTLIEQVSIANNPGQSAFATSSELMSNEIWNLLDTKPFMDDLLAAVDYSKPEHATTFTTREEIEDSIFEGLQIIRISENQLVLVMTYENPYLTYELLDNIFNLYVQRQINLAKADTGTATSAIDALVENYAQQREMIALELQAYLESHPEPQDITLARREVEQAQIDRLQIALARTNERYNNAINQQEAANLATTTIESSVRQAYLIIDGPIGPIQISGKTDKLVNAVLIGAIGGMISVVAILAIAFLNQRIVVPLDAKSSTNLPVLTMVEYDATDEEKNLLQQLLPVFAIRKRRKRKRQAVITKDTAATAAS